MKSIKEKIQGLLKNSGIVLEGDLLESYEMTHGVTNKFIKVKDSSGEEFLIRINGTLWPPFTRDSESHNLRQLEQAKIDHHVLRNNKKSGLQLSRFFDEQTRFSNLPNEKKSDDLLKAISKSIKKYHAIGTFKNSYPVADTLKNSFERLPKAEQETLLIYYKLALQMFATLNQDRNNYVSSHNDLLPSSIYIKEGDNPSFVDWEYSGENHRSYDLALLSIQAAFTSKQEDILIKSYDARDSINLSYSVLLMKPIISLLLVLWNASSKQSHVHSNKLLSSLKENMQQALVSQSAKELRTTSRLYLNKNYLSM